MILTRPMAWMSGKFCPQDYLHWHLVRQLGMYPWLGGPSYPLGLPLERTGRLQVCGKGSSITYTSHHELATAERKLGPEYSYQPWGEELPLCRWYEISPACPSRAQRPSFSTLAMLLSTSSPGAQSLCSLLWDHQLLWLWLWEERDWPGYCWNWPFPIPV